MDLDLAQRIQYVHAYLIAITLAHGASTTAPTRVHKRNSVSNGMVYMAGGHLKGTPLHPA